jgi:hypothetical protein
MRKAGNLTTKATAAALLCALIAALATVGASTAATTHSTLFPSQGLVVPGQSIAGITIGMTESQVAAKWGHGYEICTSCGKQLVWLYEYKGSEPLGAAVKFNAPAPKGSTNSKSVKGVAPSGNLLGSANPPGNTKVTAIFTLGSPTGWGIKGKVMTFDPVTNVYNVYGNLNTVQCIGYVALTAKVGQNTFSFYTSSGVIYGFALTAPSEPACQ